MPSRRILFLTPQLPYPPHQGTRIRNYHLIRELAPRHEVHLLSFVTEPDPAPQVAHLQALCRSVQIIPAPSRSLAQRALSTFFSRQPDMGLRLESSAFHQQLGQLLREPFDIVQVEGIEMAPYLMQVAALPKPRPSLVFDDHNAEYVLQRRAFEADVRKPRRWLGAAYSLVQWAKLRRYERLICRLADRVIAVSEADALALHRLWPALPVHVVPNGVDLEYFRADEAYPPLSQMPALVFTGKMDFRPNVDGALWFVEQVLPRIQARASSPVHLYLVGRDPHPRLLPLAKDPHITITGYVPDVRPFIGGAEVYIVPLRIGGGTRLKVLEALAMGKAIVSTTLGCEGIGLRDGQEVLMRDTPTAFAEAVLELLGDAERRAELGRKARHFVAARYGWERIVPGLERIYEEL